MKKIIIILTALAAFSAKAQSPVALSKRVATLPTNFQKPQNNTDIYNDGGSTSLPWIVFSDRDENYTYTAPGGSLVMKKIKFMEPFYVSKEENGYIKLIKYSQGIVQGRKLINKKAAQSYGWISKDKVLLWQSAFVNPQTGYPQKAIPIVSGRGPLTYPGVYYDKSDSLYVFTSPEMERKKTKVALHQLLYIFKKSRDGKNVLVGSEGQLLPDSAAANIYGWVPADAVHSWGDRLYITATKTGYDSDDTVSALVNKNIHYAGGKGTFAVDPLIDWDEPVMRSIPVYGATGRNYSTGNLSIGVATDVYDKSGNVIRNIRGGNLSYKDYLNIRRNIHKINVVFVVDGGSSMRNYLSGLTTSVQSFENVFNNYNRGNRITYGAVVYRNATNCGTGGIITQQFNNDYRQIIQFLGKQASITANCSPSATAQPVFEGVRNALSMFKGRRNETNLIVVIGSTGNTAYDAGMGTSLANEVAAADARILAIQVYSDYASTYNDFVIQSRKLVSQSAAMLAENKKNRMVVGEGLTSAQQFNISLSDSISFYLDFPKNSLIQGAVIFPPKGVVKTNVAMEAGLKRLMKETELDIKTQTRTLDSVFRLTGREHRFVTPLVLAQVTPASDSLGNNMPHNAFKYYLDAELPANVVTDHPKQLQYIELLSEDEYKHLSDILSLMIGDNLQQDAGNFRRKLVKNYVNVIKKNLGLKDYSGGSIKDMFLADYIQKTTGIVPPPVKQLGTYHVRDLNGGNMPRQAFEDYINWLIKTRNGIRQHALVDQHFTSNGKTYYYVTQANWME